MVITASALSLNVADERASARFARDHLGFVEEMASDGFVSLSRPDAGFNLSSNPSRPNRGVNATSRSATRTASCSSWCNG
jgi:hypothetical protein